MKRILTIDDEVNIQELLKYNLEINGYEVLQAASGEEALAVLKENQVDMLLLDLMLPGIDGLEVLKAMRNQGMNTPVIMLTAKTEEIDKVIGLEMGADDYLSKPFGVRELLARIKAVSRRFEDHSVSINEETVDDERIIIDNISINKTNYEVTVDGSPVEFSLKEFELLYLLAKNRGRAFDREYLLEKIWGYDYYGETRTVDVHIRNIRKKIEEDDSNPVYIKTVRGIGYKFSKKKE